MSGLRTQTHLFKNSTHPFRPHRRNVNVLSLLLMKGQIIFFSHLSQVRTKFTILQMFKTENLTLITRDTVNNNNHDNINY